MLDDYYVESINSRHFLVFDGDDNTKERVVAHLEQNGMRVLYDGKSHRPAANKRHYDWFVRLDFQGDAKEGQHELAYILSLEEEHLRPDTDQQKPLVATWHVESNTYGHYLVFNFDSEQEEEQDEQFGQIVTALDKADIGVKSDDASHRAADNGTQYDWYIRTDIALDETPGRALESIKKALGPVASVPSAPTLLEETNEAILINRLQQEKEVLQSKNKELQNKLQELRTGPGTGAEANIQNLQSQLDKKSQENDDLSALWTEADDASQHLNLENHALKTKCADCERRHAKLQGRMNRRPNRRPNHFRALLGLTCDRIRLDDESFNVINDDFSKIEPLVTVLQGYNSHEKQQKLKKMKECTNEVWELAPPPGHIATGRQGVSDRGRVYFRKTAEGDRFAFVRVKKNDTQQQRELREIDKYDLKKDVLRLG